MVPCFLTRGETVLSTDVTPRGGAGPVGPRGEGAHHREPATITREDSRCDVLVIEAAKAGN